MTVTIKEIARRAGVSTASVSRALNEVPGVAAATRERIAGLARELGYTPDSRAQALVTGQVPFLALVVPDITNPFYPAVAQGAEDELARQGFSLLLVSTAWRPERLERAIQLLTSRRVGGLLLAVHLGDLPRQLARTLGTLAGPVVLVGHPPPRGSGIGAAEVDDRHGGEQVGRHLAGLGWRRIAFIAGPEGNRAARARLTGFRRGLDRAGSLGRLSAVSHGAWSRDSGYAQACALLDGRRPPDAIFAANDLLALGAYQAAADRGRRPGGDLGLVGYDDIDTVRYLEVPITSVAQPKLELGRQAARLLAARIGGERAPARVRLKPELKVRHSCGAARGGRTQRRAPARKSKE